MDTLDTRFKRIADAIRALPECAREDVLSRVELEVFETGSMLSAEQIAELELRLASPMEIAKSEQVEAVFAKYGLKA